MTKLPADPARVSPVDLSIIVPLYHEEENVHLLHEAICAAVRPLALKSEIVFVDDGSKDRTFERCLELPRTNPDLRIVRFRRNAGQTAAMAAGIDHARGEVLITMDGDLQNDPQDIPLFLDKIAEGYDLVVGWRHDRQDHWSRVLPSKVANWLIGKVTGVPIKDNGCSLKAYRADLIKNIPLYNEMHRFIPAMASLAAPRIAQIKVRHHARRFGKSKYGFSRIYKVFVDLVTIRSILSFSRRPATWLGTIAGRGWAGLADVPRHDPVPARHRAAARPRWYSRASACSWARSPIFSVFLALLSHLIYGTSAARFRPFLMMSVRASEAPAGPASSTSL